MKSAHCRHSRSKGPEVGEDIFFQEIKRSLVTGSEGCLVLEEVTEAGSGSTAGWACIITETQSLFLSKSVAL